MRRRENCLAGAALRVRISLFWLNRVVTPLRGNMQLAFLGGGNMGRALIGGMLRRGTRPEHISVGESFAPARDALSADFGIQATTDNAAAVESASVVVLAVKPQIAGAVLSPLQPLLQRSRPLVISIAAGIRVAALESWCGP